MSKAILKSLAVLGALAFSTSAYASTVTVSYQGSDAFTDAGYVGVTFTGTPVPGYPDNPKPSGWAAGALALTDSTTPGGGVLGDFVAFCVDIFDAFQVNQQYEVPVGPDGVGVNNWPALTQAGMATRFDNLQKLFNTAYSSIETALADNTLTAAQSGGFQLAIWEILYEKLPGGANWPSLNVSDGTFKLSSDAGAIAYANDLLANLGGTQTASYDLIFLQAQPVDNPASQHLVTATLAPAPVPLPAAGLLLLAGLAGLGVAARRRKEV